LIKNVGVEADSIAPHDRRRLPVHDDATELIHIPPRAESAYIEKIPEKYTPLQTVLEFQPELVVPRSPAFGDAMQASFRPEILAMAEA
jgi:hypothetical protein